jgi:methylglutaconyl-CoA hydratase
MPPRILRPLPTSSRLLAFPPRLEIHYHRTNATLASSASGSVINVQQIPAPGAGHIRVLLLNRPNARNALSRQLLDSLEKHVDGITAEKGDGPTRALILASNVDSSFCAGADLKERVGFTKEEYVCGRFISILLSIDFGT